jgi:transcriptional regulator with XRE-family HTH domain
MRRRSGGEPRPSLSPAQSFPFPAPRNGRLRQDSSQTLVTSRYRARHTPPDTATLCNCDAKHTSLSCGPFDIGIQLRLSDTQDLGAEPPRRSSLNPNRTYRLIPTRALIACLLYTREVIDDEVRRFARLLEAAVKLSKMSAQQLDRKLGLAQGTLNRIFNGKIELKLRHIFMVCEALGYQPKRFFELAFDEEPQVGPTSAAEQIHSVLHRLGAGGSRLLAPAPFAESELDARIEAALRRLGVVKAEPPESENLPPDPEERSPTKRPPRKSGSAKQIRPEQPGGPSGKSRTT